MEEKLDGDIEDPFGILRLVANGPKVALFCIFKMPNKWPRSANPRLFFSRRVNESFSADDLLSTELESNSTVIIEYEYYHSRVAVVLKTVMK